MKTIFSRSLLRLSAILFFIFFVHSTFAQAQYSDKEGAFIGIHAGTGSISMQRDDIDIADYKEGGFGGGLRFGYVFNNILSLGVDLSGYSLADNSARSGIADIFGRIHAFSGVFTPFAEARFGGSLFQFTDVKTTMTALNTGIGAGIALNMKSGISVVANASYSHSWYQKARSGKSMMRLDNVTGSIIRTGIGVEYRF